MKKYVDLHNDLFSLVSEGNISLMKAVEKFDYSLGHKFSTYATWAMRNNRIRDYSQGKKIANRLSANNKDVIFNAIPDRHNDEDVVETRQTRITLVVQKVMESLDDREKEIIDRRFGLRFELRGAEPESLEGIGNDLDVSKERVRQIEIRALGKLRKALDDIGSSESREILDKIRSLPMQSDGRKRRRVTRASAENRK